MFVMNETVQNYAKQMLALYRTVFSAAHIKEAQPYYRVVKMPSENDNRVHFQIVGKNVVLNMSPEKIMRNDILLGFSKAEIVLITHLGTKNEVSLDYSLPKNKLFKIIKQLFSMG